MSRVTVGPPFEAAWAGASAKAVQTSEPFEGLRPGRQSLSAHQAAEPLVADGGIERNLDKPGASPGPTTQGWVLRFRTIWNHQLGW